MTAMDSMTGAGGATSGYTEVAGLLWREREVLERLLYKLTVERLVASAGESRWLAAATRELETAAEEFRGIEVLRAAEVDELAERIGLPAGSALEELADAAPEPWGDILRDHREALRNLAGEVAAASAENRRLLEVAARTVDEALRVRGGPGTYDAQGVRRGDSSGAYRVDEQV